MRWLKAILILWMAVWTALVVPAHTRGAIPFVPVGCAACQARDRSEAADAACCAAGRSSRPTPQREKGKNSPENCLICQTVASTPNEAVAVPVDMSLSFLEMKGPEEIWIGAVAEMVPAYDSRGPPAQV